MQNLFTYKKLFRFAAVLGLWFMGSAAQAQTDPLYLDGNITVGAGDTLRWYGPVELAPTLKLYIQSGGVVQFYGSTLKIDTKAQIFSSNATFATKTQGTGTAKIAFIQVNPIDGSTVLQTLDGGNSGNPANTLRNTIPTLEINNARGVKLVNSETRIGSNLNFVKGHLYTDVQDAVLASAATITGADATKYVVTAAPGATGGHLVKEDFTGAFLFPVGMADNDYTPATVTPGTANTVHVNVTSYANDGLFQNQGADGMNHSWNIWGNSATAANIGLQHNSTTDGSSWSQAANFVTQYGTSPNNTGDVASTSPWQSNTPGASTAAGGAGTETNGRMYTSLAINATANEAWYSKASNTVKPLPLQLLSFTANKQLGSTINTAVLNWTAAEQVNTHSFVVERSMDGKNFIAIGTQAAAGTCAGEISYTFADANAQTGANYYRLKMVDMDGKSTYSPTKMVAFEATATQNIYVAPNPTRGQFYVKGFAGKAIVRIVDMGGRIILEQTGVDQYTMLNITQLPSAVYLVQVLQDGKFAGTYKLVKQ